MIRRTSRLERLARREERTTLKQIVYLSVFSLILAFFLFRLGIPLLAKFADFLEIFLKKNGEESQLSNKSVLRPPKIDDLPAATNSAKLAISGLADESTSVVVYLDSEEIGKVEVKDGKFNYQDLFLKGGKNEIWAKSIATSGIESGLSTIKTVVLDLEEPRLEVESPFDGQSFAGNNRILVAGKADKDAQVYVNGFLANINPEGKFEVSVPVSEGENIIEIKAFDDAGNVKIEKRKINFKK